MKNTHKKKLQPKRPPLKTLNNTDLDQAVGGYISITSFRALVKVIEKILDDGGSGGTGEIKEA